MKATLTVADLVPALECSARAASSQRVQILGGLRFEVTDGLAITGMDMELLITTDVSLMKGRRRGVVVAGPAKQIVAAVKTLPADAVVTLEKIGDRFVVSSGRSILKFETYPAEDYPKLPTSGQLVATVKTPDLIDAFDYVSNCYSTDSSRPVLRGVKLEFEGSALRMIATDSFRLGSVETSAEVHEAWEGIVPGASLVEAIRIAKTTELVEIHQSDHHVWFFVEDTDLAVRKIDGMFPNWRQFRPAEFLPKGRAPIKISLDRSQAVDSCKRILKLSSSAGTPLRLSVTPGAKHVTFSLAGSYDDATIEETIDATIKSKEQIEFGVNAGFFADALATAQGDSVHLRLINTIRPIFISGNDIEDPDRWMIVMPIRLAG